MAGATPQMLIRIAANLEKLKQNLAEGKGQIEVTTAGMQKLAASLDGSRLEQKAHNITAAINEVGGASKLTDAEARRLLPTLDAWIEKGQRMGKEIPPDILKTRDALKEIDTASKAGASSGTTLLGTLAKIGGAVGIAFSVGAIKNFVVSVFDSAGKIHDLASQMGVSTDAVQGFKFAAEQAGSSLDSVGTAITKMNSNLAEGDKSTVKALKDAGLSFQQIRSMKPEDAFLAITDAVQKIPDPMIQSDVALKLFGKSAAELLPAMKEGFRAASDSAAKMSEETINDLEAAGDAWGRLADRMTIISGTLIANTMKTTSQITKSWSAAALFADDVIKFGIGAATAMAKAREEAERGGKRVQDIYLGTAPVVHKTKEELDAAAAAAKRHATEIENLADKYNGMKKEVGNLAEVMRKMKPGDDWKGLAEDIGKLSRDGGKLTPEMTQLAIAFGTLTPAVKLGADGIENLGLRIDVAIPKLSAFNQAVLDLAEKTKWGFEGLPQLGFKVSDGFDAAAQKMAKDATASKKLLDDLAQSFTQLAQIGGDALGGIVKAFGTLVVSAKTAKEGIDSIKSGFSKGGLGGLLEMTTGFAGLASAAIAAGKAIWNLFHQNQGRDLVKDFAASMGGFDALQQKLLALGPEYDKLWRGLTQLNKNSSTQEAQAAIDAVTAALERQKGKTSEVAAASAEAAKKQIEAQQEALDAITAKYATTISKLDSEYQSLNDSVSKEAEEAVMGLVETQERARMDQIKAEKAAQEAMRDAEIAAKQSTFDDLLKDGQATNDELRKYYRDNPLEIPYSYVPKNTPGWAAPGEGIPPGASSASSGWPSGFTAPAGAAAGGDINIHNTLMMPDGDVLLKQTVKAGQRRGWM